MDRRGMIYLEACNNGIFSPDLSFFYYDKQYIRNPPKHRHLYGYPFVYFLFKEESLIYIGSTTHLPSRISSHIQSRCMKFDSVMGVMFHHFGADEYPARRAEKSCIGLFRPKQNIQYNPDYVKHGRKNIYLPDLSPDELKEILNEETVTK